MQTNKKWVVYPNSETVADEACQLIKQLADDAIQNRGVFRIVLAGGTTPGKIYQMLAKEHYDWSKWEFYLGDERCLPIESEERNSQMILETWLNKVDVPADNIHFIDAELGAEMAAKNYAEVIEAALPFDLVLLGMGEDGHTASLFPGQVHDDRELTHAVYNSPKPPSDRVSLSASSLNNARQVLMIVTGAGKKESVTAWQNGDSLPIAKITALESLTIMLDEAAYPHQD